MTDKYDRAAASFTKQEYGDPARYFSRRAELVATIGQPLVPGDRVLDLACADGSFAEPLLARGLAYTGVDASEAMIEVAQRRFGEAARFVAADALAFTPPDAVAATTIFRSLNVVPDRVAFFRHVASFTRKKLVFDVSPRRESVAELRAQLRQAGWGAVDVRPFFVPQHVALPRPALALLAAAARVGPLAGLVLRRQFSVLVAATLPGGTRS